MIGHIQRTVDEHQNQIVRNDETLDGIISIQRNSDDTYDIRLCDGTESEATLIEGVTKSKLLDMIEKKL
jgi:hypothetical protein